MSRTLLLGSKSLSRQALLNDMGISFILIGQDSDETLCVSSSSFKDVLTAIACEKMDHVIMPTAREGEDAFVLTADTMGRDARGKIHGKPLDRDDAIAKIKALRGRGLVATSFCLDRKRFDGATWQVEQRITTYVETEYVFDMPDEWIDAYLERTPHYLHVSGAITIGGYGAQFLKWINGSYTTILGLPVFELRQALESSGFFN